MSVPKNPWMKLWVSDIVASCSDMTAEEFGTHMRLLLYAWDRGYCPPDPIRLSMIAGGVHESVIESVLTRWTLVPGKPPKLIHPRLELERARAIERSATNSKSGTAGAIARWSKQSDNDMANAIVSPLANAWQIDGILDARSQRLEVITAITPNGCNSSECIELEKVVNTTCAEPRKKRSRSAQKIDAISWSQTNGWQGIADADRSAWAVAYPSADISQELEKANQWLVSNPAKSLRSLWRRFLTNWLSRCQERGGSRQGASTAFRRDESHIPPDCADNQKHLWWMPDGRTPRRVPIYTTIDGRDRYLDGTYA